MPEEKPSLLHHEHLQKIENPYDPDAQMGATTLNVVERAASESRHEIMCVREIIKLGREEEAKLALENTEIKPVIAWAMTVLFLLTIFIPSILQSTIEVQRNLQERSTSGIAEARIAPQIFDVLNELPTSEQIRDVRSFAEVSALVPNAERIWRHEQTLEDESILINWILPRAQYYLTKWGGVGNEQAYIGRDGWLFYRPDVDYLISPGFLDPDLQRVRARAGDTSSEAVQPDPVPAITHFQQQLKQRGIKLIIMPIPVKPMFQAEKMSTSLVMETSLQNPSYDQFLQRLQEKCVYIFDPTEELRLQQTTTKASQFLQNDTHWTPNAMESVAKELALRIEKRVDLSPLRHEYSRHATIIENLGDTAAMLNLLQYQDLFPKQRVTIRQVHDASGEVWQSDKKAEVLLLGDSFCNIYSLAGMGWGSGAGFAEQLSFYLQRPLDSITVNAGGSHTSRQRLVGEMQRAKKTGNNRLATTKVIIWEFSMRDLLDGDWKILELP